MTLLAERLAPGTGDVARAADGRALARAEAGTLRPAPDLGPGASVALCVDDPLALVRLLLALDGRVGTLLLLSHALPAETALGLMEAAGCAHLVTDRADLLGREGARAPEAALGDAEGEAVVTRWLMTTSGTTGLPKIVPHSLDSLARSVSRPREGATTPTWGLLYDPTRFAGLQVVLQALLGGGLLVLADTARPLPEQVEALAAAGCTALSATPTLWRRILMVPGHGRLPLRQATLGGEIADQGTLDALRTAFPEARVTHIYASTEAGVGFSVKDGRAGFPEAFLDEAPGGVRMRVEDGILWIRPPVRSAEAPPSGIEVDAEGFVRTGDRIEVLEGRATFLGRDNGTINIGGVKVHPERVEAAIRTVPEVALAQVSPKKSPLMGALVVAEVQLREGADPAAARAAILAACRERLEREAVPAIIRFVDGFTINAAGKLVRTKEAGP